MSLSLRAFLTDMGYTDLRIVRGRVCGLLGLDLVAGLDMAGCDAVYTFENASEARAALAAWDGAGHPQGPWIRLIGQGGRVDLRNPDFAPPVFGRVGHAQA